MTRDVHTLGRRSLRAGLGTAVVAAAGAGLGPTAYCNDRERFDDSADRDPFLAPGETAPATPFRFRDPTGDGAEPDGRRAVLTLASRGERSDGWGPRPVVLPAYPTVWGSYRSGTRRMSMSGSAVPRGERRTDPHRPGVSGTPNTCYSHVGNY